VHVNLLLELAKKMDTEALETFAQAEIASLESGQSPVQRIKKYFLMRESCLSKIFGISEEFSSGDFDYQFRQAIRAEARKRLCDLSKITLHFIEALAKWSAFINSVAQTLDVEPKVYHFGFDDDNLDIFDMLFTDAAELAQAQVFAQDELQSDDLFFTKVLAQADARDAQSLLRRSDNNEENRRRAW